MLTNAPDTPLDLRFRLFRFPVRVTIWFWLVMALLGEDVLRFLGPSYLALWVLCGFVSILVHELGHAVLIRRFGHWCDIELIAFGGLAIPSGVPVDRWKRIAISLAGPGFGFGFLLLIVVSDWLTGWSDVAVPLAAMYSFLVMMNLFWNLINLLPIWPLDGGKVCREVCQASPARNPDAIAFGIGFFTAAGIAAIGVLAYLRMLPPAIAMALPYIPGMFMSIWFILFAVENYQLWERAKRQRGWDSDPDDDTPPWQRR